jgi:hypothetical protein
VCVDYSYIYYSLTIKIKFCESWVVAVETVDCVVQFPVHVDMFSIVRVHVVQMKNIAHVCDEKDGLKCGCGVGRENEKNKVNWNSICPPLSFVSSLSCHLFSMKDER